MTPEAGHHRLENTERAALHRDGGETWRGDQLSCGRRSLTVPVTCIRGDESQRRGRHSYPTVTEGTSGSTFSCTFGGLDATTLRSNTDEEQKPRGDTSARYLAAQYCSASPHPPAH
ncbi:hypothetical protein NDU88_000870 [Pleurodeles waltl]|uniref:Uncharacterized protein n=1 Tax=Pleurodeles waltl TaxID=8319 RepID=A0AAV7SBA9_PLEWA|nr:hypothetical protein NDU88_000870 [Pleurodeles waltl]